MATNQEEWKSYLYNCYKTTIAGLAFAKQTQNRLLFVESEHDQKTYCSLLNLPVIKNADTLDISLEKQYIRPASEIVSDWYNPEEENKTIENCVPGNIYAQHAQPKKTKKRRKPAVFSAVVDVVKCCYDHADLRSKYDSYGFIDKDTDGHKELIHALPIATTEMHDRETTIFRYCFPDCFAKMANQESVEESLTKIIEYAYRQGLLEITSFSYKDESNFSLIIKKIVHDELIVTDDSKKMPSLYWIMKNEKSVKRGFRNYIWSKKQEHTNELKESDTPRFEAFYKDFEILCENEINYDIKTLINRWLNKKLEENDEEKLDKIFTTCNGHIIISFIIALERRSFKLRDLYKFVGTKQQEAVVKYIFDCASPDALAEMQRKAPITKYIGHCLKKNLYTYIK